MAALLQDILTSLCETLRSGNQQAAAAEADSLFDEVQYLKQMAANLQNDGFAMAVREQHYRHSSGSTRAVHAMQHSRSGVLPAIAHRVGNCSSGRLAAAASLQSCPSLRMTSSMSTSKASRYLQKRVFKRPSALQQMQAFTERHSRESDAECNQVSLADSCSSMAGMSGTALRHLQAALPPQAMPDQDRMTASIDDVDQVDTTQVWLQLHTASLLHVIIFIDLLLVPAAPVFDIGNEGLMAWLVL